ncbi:Exc2 family lipoprotein [Nissabacter archeti]|uniref:Exc2 family lipoprotein n=1 Tax=Nissabacter archeti TaxID=1917880 RepID=A0ABS5JLC9_9GAMM|nr:Exc2 family lipoprotein [Nissabacter archeti]MBS0970765.1 Exc2 family lipoprotein [Nissabacter archeti]
MMPKLLLPSVLVGVLLLSACSGPQTSVSQHARHMAYQLAGLHFDPNTQPLTTDNARRMEKFLSQFYDLGKQDRVAGLTAEQAQQRVASFSQAQDGATDQEGPFSPVTQKSAFINHEYEADQPEKRSKLLLEGAIATYWDGYHGKP